MRKPIHTTKAPAAIGSYSQAIVADNTVYLSGQIPLDPETMTLVDTSIESQVERVFLNMKIVAEAAGGTLNDIVKLTVYLINLENINIVNDMIAKHFTQPYPARTSIGIAALPKNAAVEIDAIMILR